MVRGNFSYFLLKDDNLDGFTRGTYKPSQNRVRDSDWVYTLVTDTEILTLFGPQPWWIVSHCEQLAGRSAVCSEQRHG